MKKKLLIIILLLFATVKFNFGQANGDVCIIGMNSDNPDKVLLVTLTDIAPSTVIYLTDNEWDGTAWITGEGFKSFTVSASGLVAGDVVELDLTNNTVTPTTDGNVASVAGSFALGTGGDQLYIYLGTDENTPTTFLFALNTAGGWGTNELLNTGLTDGVNALTFPSSTDDVEYTAYRTGYDAAGYKTFIADVSTDWVTSSSAFTFDLTDFVISGNDQTSTVTAPTTQLVAGTISSIGTDSVPVMRFDITDAASGDGLPTVVTGIYFVAGQNNTLDFQNNLAGGGVYDLTNNALVPVDGQNTVITATTAFLPVNLTVPDGGTVSLEAYVYIDNTNAPDGGILQFQINAASHGFTADASGSDFETTFAGGDIAGNNFTVDVTATQFTFLTQPSDVVVNAIMSSFQVATTDAFGNVDIDNNLNYIKILFSGTGSMYGTSGLSTNNGICTYTDLYFNTSQTGVHLTANDGNGTIGFSDVNSTNFNILPNSGGATCGEAVSVDVGTHHAIHPQGGSGDYDQWYVYHATANGTITVSDCGETVDTDLQIIEDNCSGTNFDEVDDNCSSQETLDFTVVAGTDYYIGWGNWDTAGDEHDWTLSFREAINIMNAYAVNNNELTLEYESALTSVDPADYNLTATGQTTVTFSNALIDGSDPTIVHLTAASNFAINTIRDNINDAYNNATYQFYAGVLPVSYTNTANDPDTVRQGYNVTLSGIVTANDNYNQVWIQDSDNPMSGVMIYSSSFDAVVNVGDSITLTGQKALYNGATEIVNPMLISVESGHTEVPANINSADLEYNKIQDDPAAEQWEGQLVTVSGIVIDSLNSSDYEYFGHDCNGNIICFDDDVDYHYGSGFALTTGSMYSITGVVTYSYGHYKINPRGTADAAERIRDFTSVAEAPDAQVTDGVIDGTLALDSLNAITAFKFKITDEGSDGFPTKLHYFDIYIGPNNTIDLTGDEIAGGWFDFGDAANPIVFAGEPQFDTDHFTFEVDPETAIIDNGTSKEVILHLWFDANNIVDESALQFMIKADPHGFDAACMNSQFAPTFANDIVGGTLTIDTNIGIKDIFANSIRIYPNPSNGIFNIDVENRCNLEISDITGRVLSTRTLTGNTSIQLNTAGIYFLKFSNDKGSYTQKVVVR